MTLRQLTYFLSVVDHSSFKRASEALLIAQPSLSQAIQTLERELGGPLLERRRGGVHPTAAGRLLVEEARRAVDAAGRGARLAKSANNAQAGQLELATVSSAAVGILPPVLKRWKGAHGETRLVLHEFQHRDRLEECVRNGAGDLAVGPTPESWNGPVFPLGWEQFVIVVHGDHPFARETVEAVEMERLADEQWVLFERTHGAAEIVSGVCRRAGFHPRGVVETSHVVAAAHLVAAGLGVTLLPIEVVPPGLGLHAVTLAEPVVRELSAYGRAPTSPLAGAFIDLMHDLPLLPEPPANAHHVL